jgi:hypothetical protein
MKLIIKQGRSYYLQSISADRIFRKYLVEAVVTGRLLWLEAQ